MSQSLKEVLTSATEPSCWTTEAGGSEGPSLLPGPLPQRLHQPIAVQVRLFNITNSQNRVRICSASRALKWRRFDLTS